MHFFPQNKRKRLTRPFPQRTARRGSTAVSLQSKRWVASAQSLALFGRRLAWQRLRHYPKAGHEVVVSDGDEGLERVREAEFPQAVWLLDAAF